MINECTGSYEKKPRSESDELMDLVNNSSLESLRASNKELQMSNDRKMEKIFKQMRQEKWEKLFTKVTTTLEYKEEWNNGTGYFNHILDEDVKTIAKFNTPEPNNRRGIVINVDGLGKVCVFERYTPKTGSPFVLVSNHWFERGTMIQRLMSGLFDGNIFPVERTMNAFFNLCSEAIYNQNNPED